MEKQVIKKDKDNICEYTLEAQLRILNGKSEKFAKEFVAFVKELLGIEYKILDDQFINYYKERLGETGYFRNCKKYRGMGRVFIR